MRKQIQKSFYLISGLLILISTPALALQFTLDTLSLHSENSASAKYTRFGLAKALNQNDFLMYAGKRFYFLKTQNQEWGSVNFQTGLLGGVSLGLSVTDSRVCCSVDTVDGYFGVLTEFAWQTWGWGLEYNHFSAHNSDGRFIHRPLQIVNEYSVSVKAGYSPWETFHIQSWVHWLHDDLPRDRVIHLEIGVATTLGSWLGVEAFAKIAPREPDFEALRLKLSYQYESAHPKVVPYVLLHTGDHYFGQRYTEQITQIMAGVELTL